MITRWKAGLAALGLLAAAGTAVVLTATSASADTVICEKYGSTTIQGGRYIVQNNVWGTDQPQCITVTSTGFSISQANHNVPTNGAPASYPSVYYGCHYANCSSGSILPLRVSDSRFGTLQSSVSMSYPGSGQWDAAYDIWFDPTPRTDGQNTGAEIMIWLNHAGAPQPVGSRVATVNLAGGTWDVWYGNIGWNVISYVRTQGTGSLNFAPATFFNDTVSRGYAQTSWYLTSLQAGFEPWTGGQGLAVNSFSVTTDGQPPTSNPPTSSSPPPNPGGGKCSATYVKNDWGSGFTAEVTVTNTGSSAISAWTVGWSFSGNQRITNSWNATVSQSGTAVTARNASYNGSIPPGGKTTFGFQASYSGSNPVPSLTCS
ncbi:cellulose binding domain-containing protein [Dactylosporangium sp. AC04546]|nr:cellulose binding domain-containing protein [Dactylosporangium sp. AC04546]WVK87601.1 cellulose binding domain-containing protein [Dactylosporangium sp. AC04546]